MPTRLHRSVEVAAVGALVTQSLERYGYSVGSGVELIGDSENLTYRVVAAADRPEAILRVYRQGYHSIEAIRSELCWLQALRRESKVVIPAVIPADDGSLCIEMRNEVIPEGRRFVLFELLSGREPQEHELVESFLRLGEVTALLHEHAANWTLPEGFVRHSWNLDTMLLAREPTWGRWQHNEDLSPDALAVLTKAEAVIVRRLEDFGSRRANFGVIHADLRPQNLLFDGKTTKVIDFDDCGFSWYLYDLGAALTFVEDHPSSDTMVQQWITGYEAVRTLTSLEKEELDTFRLLRRLIVIAWLASHQETMTAQTFNAGYTERAAAAARRYLRRFG